MIAISAEIVAKRYTGVDIKVNNGVRDFGVNIDKKKLTYEEFRSIDGAIEVRVYTLIRNCCTGKPLAIFQSGRSEKDTIEIKELIESIDSLISKELKEILL
ncbi:hypothetical protein [uncultured Clostridium sp.]|uniref:hypothetical protein n=1 Tax=uncultured Clostridium sp. TaxID=59620 RepID=UPI0026114EE3|nr:hypothetical protein [uncultured Clostridium sp.]